MTGRAPNVYRRTDGAELTPLWDSGLTVRDTAAELASRELNDATQAMFRRWERANGFVEGAGQTLLPAGWNAADHARNLKTACKIEAEWADAILNEHADYERETLRRINAENIANNIAPHCGGGAASG